MNISAGSAILDLGAGFGLYSFRLGSAVGPSGTVFATDVDGHAIDYLTEHARKKGLTNVVPVKVSCPGFDSFYRVHSFDLIFASDVIGLIRSPEAFFDELRPSLKKETGRLWIITLQPDPDFTIVEFGDPDMLRRALLSGPKQSAIVSRLSEAAREALAAQATTTHLEQMATLVLEDLNKMLADPTLWTESREKKWPLNQRDASVRQTVSQALVKKGAFTSSSGVKDDTRRALRWLNRVLILDLMDNELWGKSNALNKLSKSQLEPFVAQISSGPSWAHPPFFEKAGFECVREHSEMPYCSVWEFKRTR